MKTPRKQSDSLYLRRWAELVRWSLRVKGARVAGEPECHRTPARREDVPLPVPDADEVVTERRAEQPAVPDEDAPPPRAAQGDDDLMSDPQRAPWHKRRRP